MSLSFAISLRHTRYCMLMTALCILVVLRNVLGVPIPLMSFLAAGVILCVLCDEEEIVAFICSIAPFEMTFQYRYMLLIGAVGLVIKSRRHSLKNILPIICMLVWELLHFMGGDFVAFEIIREFSVLITLGIILAEKPKDYSDGLPMRSLALTTLFSCLITVIVNRRLTGYSIASGDRLGSTYELAESFNALLNPNTGAFLCVLSICGLVLLQRNKNKRKMDISIIVLLSLLIVLFQSKSAMISLFFAVIIYLYANNRNWIIPTFKVLGIILLITVVVFVFFREAVMGFIMRFMVGDISTGRVGIFKFYHDYLLSDWENILFGVGLFGYSTRIARQFSVGTLAISGAVTYVDNRMILVVSHNNVQEVILTWGIPGLVLMVWLLYKIIKHKRMNRNILHYLAFDYILLFTLQGQLLSSNVALIGLIFSMVCMEYENNTQTPGLLNV